MLGERLNHRALGNILTSFKVVNASAKDSVLGDTLNFVLRTVIIGINLRNHGQPDFLGKFAPLGNPAGITSENHHMGGTRADLLIFHRRDSADINERQLERTALDRSLDPVHELRSELGFVSRLTLRRQLGIVVYSFLEPRSLAVGARRYHIRIRRARDCAKRLFQSLTHTTFTGPRRTGKDNLFHDRLLSASPSAGELPESHHATLTKVLS